MQVSKRRLSVCLELDESHLEIRSTCFIFRYPSLLYTEPTQLKNCMKRQNIKAETRAISMPQSMDD